jgi:hypothetical protein
MRARGVEFTQVPIDHYGQFQRVQPAGYAFG